jgi:hypothetical protein
MICCFCCSPQAPPFVEQLKDRLKAARLKKTADAENKKKQTMKARSKPKALVHEMAEQKELLESAAEVAEHVQKETASALRRLDRHRTVLVDHRAVLRGHASSIDENTDQLADHGAQLALGGAVLDDHAALINECTAVLDNHDARIVENVRTLHNQADVLVSYGESIFLQHTRQRVHDSLLSNADTRLNLHQSWLVDHVESQLDALKNGAEKDRTRIDSLEDAVQRTNVVRDRHEERLDNSHARVTALEQTMETQLHVQGLGQFQIIKRQAEEEK